MKKNNIVILGGSGLIGDAVIKNLIKKRFNIILIDITLSNQNKKLYKTKKIEFIKFDLTKINNHKKLVSGIFKKYLFINAFVNCSYPSKVEKNKINPKKIDSNKFIKNLNNHLFSFYNLSFLFCEFMAKQKYGSIVNLSSIYGLNGPKFSIYKGLKNQMSVSPDYAAIKSGIIGFTKYLCSLYGEYNIRVNSVSPGGIYNNQDKKFVDNYIRHVPLMRMAKPEDVALPIIFLCSDDSKYITGVNLLVDGGWSAI